jgi:Zn ribbon nucleic-acid-binding protein
MFLTDRTIYMFIYIYYIYRVILHIHMYMPRILCDNGLITWEESRIQRSEIVTCHTVGTFSVFLCSVKTLNHINILDNDLITWEESGIQKSEIVTCHTVGTFSVFLYSVKTLNHINTLEWLLSPSNIHCYLMLWSHKFILIVFNKNTLSLTASPETAVVQKYSN